MLKPSLLLAVLLSFSIVTWAQELELNCTQTLRTARSTYDQGRLHEIPPLLEKCLENGFSDAERIEALKILVQTYIYLEEPDQADAAMLSLLQTEHFFEPNEQVDPIEFRSLYKKFRTDPIWRAGLKVGVLSSQFAVLEVRSVWAAAPGEGSYSSQVGVQFGGVFEKDYGKRFVAAPELMFSSYSFDYSNTSLLTEDQPGGAPTQQLLNSISHQRLNLNLLVQYKLGKLKGLTDTFIPFVALGPSINYLMGSSSSLTTNVTELVTGPSVDTRDSYVPLTFSAIASVGMKYRIGGLYLTADLRYQYGLSNIAKEDAQYRWEGPTEPLADYGYVDNNFLMHQISLNIGIILPKFSPVKLIR